MISPVRGVQRRIQRERAVPVVFKAVAFGAARRQRQHRIQAVQRLDRRLLVGGKHDRVLRRIQVEPDHVGRFLLELRIVRQHVALEPMRLTAGAAPDARDQHVTDAQHLAQLARAPMRAAVGRLLPRLRQDARFQRRRPHRRRLAAVLRAQPGQPLGLEPLFPAADVVRVTAHRRRDRRERLAVGQHQNHLRPPRILRADLAAADAAFQFGAFIGRQRQRHMAPQYTTSNSVVTVH